MLASLPGRRVRVLGGLSDPPHMVFLTVGPKTALSPLA